MKVKAVEKKIFGEHKKHNGLTEIEAKVVYVKTARSLSTYGVTFFLVKVHILFIIWYLAMASKLMMDGHC